MLRALEAQPASALVIFLLSGGGSSIVEKPIDDEISLDDLIATYRALVHSGAPIAEINTVRKHLSAVKGGRLAQAAFPAQQVSLLVSDVPGWIRQTRWRPDRPCPIRRRWKIVIALPRSTIC